MLLCMVGLAMHSHQMGLLSSYIVYTLKPIEQRSKKLCQPANFVEHALVPFSDIITALIMIQ